MRALALGEDDQAPDEHSAAPLRGNDEQSDDPVIDHDQTDKVSALLYFGIIN
jgi:hypothetical protein